MHESYQTKVEKNRVNEAVFRIRGVGDWGDTLSRFSFSWDFYRASFARLKDWSMAKEF